MHSLLKTLPVLFFAMVLSAAVFAPLEEEPPNCNCITQCKTDAGTGNRVCACPPDPCHAGNYECKAIAAGTGPLGALYRCKCKEVTDPDSEAFWEEECLCKYSYEIGSTHCYPNCFKNACSASNCNDLPVGEFTDTDQPCCECPDS